MNRNHGQGSGKQFEGDARREGQAGVTNGRRDRIPREIPTKSYRASMEEAERRLREWESTLHRTEEGGQPPVMRARKASVCRRCGGSSEAPPRRRLPVPRGGGAADDLRYAGG